MDIFQDSIKTSIGTISLVSTGKGLAFVGLKDSSGRQAARFIADQFPRAQVRKGGKHNKAAARQLNAYLNGKLTRFTVRLDLRREGFARKALQRVKAIPYGKTRTYGEIAAALGNPNAARAVGGANGSNPIPIFIPCHRVVAAGGLGGYGGGIEMKRALLKLEGAILKK